MATSSTKRSKATNGKAADTDGQDEAPISPSAVVDGARAKLKELRELAGVAGAAHYRRMQLCDGLLQDREWMTQFLGDEGAAHELLAKEYLADLCGLITFEVLIGVYRHFSDESEWKARRYNLSLLRADWEKTTQTKKQRGTAPSQSHRPTKDEMAAKEQQVKELECKLTRSEEQRETVSEKVIRLEEENTRLKVENAELRGRVNALESTMGRRGVA